MCIECGPSSYSEPLSFSKQWQNWSSTTPNSFDPSVYSNDGIDKNKGVNTSLNCKNCIDN